MTPRDTLDEGWVTVDAGVVKRIPEGGAVADGMDLCDEECEQEEG